VNTISTIVANLARAMYVIAGIALASSMILTVADVILRSVKRPIVGTFELVGLLGAVVIGFGIPETSRMQGHVLMDFLTEKLPHGLVNAFRVVTRLLGIVTFVVIATQLWSMGADFRRAGEVTPTLHLPLHPVAWGISVCCFVQCAVLLLEIFEKKGEKQ